VVWHGSHGFGILLRLFSLFSLFSSSSLKRHSDDEGKRTFFITTVALFVLYSDESVSHGHRGYDRSMDRLGGENGLNPELEIWGRFELQ